MPSGRGKDQWRTKVGSVTGLSMLSDGLSKAHSYSVYWSSSYSLSINPEFISFFTNTRILFVHSRFGRIGLRTERACHKDTVFSITYSFFTFILSYSTLKTSNKHHSLELSSHFTVNSVPKTIRRRPKQHLKQYIKTFFHQSIPLQYQMLAHTSRTFV